jgi:hypothetical protein
MIKDSPISTLQRGCTRHKRILDRSRGRCEVPGCSHCATRIHAIRFRSPANTSDRPEDVVCVCATHDVCIHNGWVRVWGEAPDGLYWELGVRPGFPSLLTFAPANAGEAVAARLIA